MRNFERRSPGGWKGAGGAGGDRPMFKATCANCGNIAEVPFKPDGRKPVYCRDCFKKEHDGEERSFGREERGGGFGFEEKRMYQATCANCGNIAEVPFKPNGSKPIYCRNCFKKDGAGQDAPRFERRAAPESRNAGQGSEELRAISAKLDAILKLLAPAQAPAKAAAPVEAAKTPKAEKAPKAAAKKKPAAKKKK